MTSHLDWATISFDLVTQDGLSQSVIFDSLDFSGSLRTCLEFLSDRYGELYYLSLFYFLFLLLSATTSKRKIKFLNIYVESFPFDLSHFNSIYSWWTHFLVRREDIMKKLLPPIWFMKKNSTLRIQFHLLRDSNIKDGMMREILAEIKMIYERNKNIDLLLIARVNRIGKEDKD